jgi:pyruvate/2-oxoglutarate dehydrogenase complex dihydrolipoamide dehydrogenase (E3) component
VTHDSRDGLTGRLETMAGLTFLRGQARFEGSDRLRVGDEVLTAPRIFLNVGGRAFVPDLPGVDRVPFLDNSSLLALEELPEHLLIVGGSYIGLEFAQIYARFGAG